MSLTARAALGVFQAAPGVMIAHQGFRARQENTAVGATYHFFGAALLAWGTHGRVRWVTFAGFVLRHDAGNDHARQYDDHPK